MSDEQNETHNDVELNQDNAVGALNGGSRSGLGGIGKYRPLLKIVAVIVFFGVVIWGYYAINKSPVVAAHKAVNSNGNTGNGSAYAKNLNVPPPAPVTPKSSGSSSVKATDSTKGSKSESVGASNAASSQVAKTWVSAPTIDTSTSPLIPKGVSGFTSDSSVSNANNDSGLSASDQAQIAALKAEQAQDELGSSNPQSSSSSQSTTQLGGMLKGTQTASVSASVLAHQDYLLSKGTFINAVLDTKIDSSVAGLTKATVTHNIYSVNGATLLIPKGSIVTGEYQSGVMQGQARLFVLWERLLTPSGIVVNLSSPSTGSLGGSGIGGAIDSHFWKRFGGAIMLSFVNDFGNALSNMGNSSTFSSTQQAAQQMATESLKNTINIPPTIIVNQGARIGIFVARDVNFSSVYQLVRV